MATKIYPCIWFDGNGHEAAEFYCSVFAQSKIRSVNPFVTSFEIENQRFMCLNGGPEYKPNPAISFFNMCDSVEEINNKWALLSADGHIMMPLDAYPWSSRYGWCQDKYGVCWQLMMRDYDREKIFPSIMFTQQNSGKAKEAIEFYVSIFSNASIRLLSEYQEGEGDVAGYLKHGQFLLNDQLFTAMDSSGAHSFIFSEGISFVVECDDQGEIDHYWDKLTEGGVESKCGWLKDKYGISWQIVPSVLGSLMSDPSKAPYVMHAFMQMKKFDINTLLNAAKNGNDEQ